MKPYVISSLSLTASLLITSLLLTSQFLKFCSAEGSSCTDNGPVHIILSEDGAHGQISDGEDAINSAHCEWLIERNETTLPGAFISITFIELATECSFDYVFVRDGASSANSKLIGALSGIQNDVRLTSSSGKVSRFTFLTIYSVNCSSESECCFSYISTCFLTPITSSKVFVLISLCHTVQTIVPVMGSALSVKQILRGICVNVKHTLVILEKIAVLDNALKSAGSTKNTASA